LIQLASKKRVTKLVVVSAALMAMIFVLPSVIGITSFASNPTFSSAVNLSNDGNNAQYPMVANSGQNVYVAWTEEGQGIFVRTSSNGGATFGSAMKLSPKGGVTAYPVITANGSYVYVAWSQVDPGSNKTAQIYFSASSNSGASFSTAIIVDVNSSQAAITPVLAGWGSNVYVAWSNNGPSWVRASNNAGQTWGPAYNLGAFHEPQLAAWGSNVYFVSDGHGGMAYGVSHNYGQTWNSSVGTMSEAEPWIAAAGNYVYIAWEQKHTNGTAPIYGMISDNNGTSFGPTTVLSGSVINDWEPQLTASGNNVYLAFRSLSPQSAWITMSSNNGATWTTPVDLSGKGNQVGWPLDIAVSGNYAYTIFGASTTGSTWNAYTSYTTNGGSSWSPTGGVDLSLNSAGVAAPATDVASASIMANGGHAFAAWESTQSGNEQIWFAYS
jgi:hypothetical protein